jgi:hypothetical protein
MGSSLLDIAKKWFLLHGAWPEAGDVEGAAIRNVHQHLKKEGGRGKGWQSRRTARCQKQ